MGVTVERCETGIVGFDKLCDGGFVRDSVNVILGGPGSGKTTFLLQFIWNGAMNYDENGAYISFEPDIADVLQDARTHEWDFSKLEAKGKCRFIRLSPKTAINDLKAQLTELVSKYDVQRICLDPVSVLSMNIEKENQIREMIFELASLLKRLKVTVLLAEETVDGSVDNLFLGEGVGRTHFIKFLSDGLVNFYSSGLGGASDRAVRIVKMRRTNHIRGPVPFKITDKGITVLPRG